MSVLVRRIGNPSDSFLSHIDTDDFLVVAQIEQAVGQGGGLTSGSDQFDPTEFFKGFGSRSDDDQFASHCGNEELAVGSDQVPFAETELLPSSFASASN